METNAPASRPQGPPEGAGSAAPATTTAVNAAARPELARAALALIQQSPANVWLRAKLDFTVTTAPLVEEKIGDTLFKASSGLHLSFQNVAIEKPPAGTMILVKLAPDQPMRLDGYGWVGGERVEHFKLNSGSSLRAHIHSGGFETPDATQCTVERTRYQLVLPNGAPSLLQIVRWVHLPEDRRGPVDAARVTVRPRTGFPMCGVFNLDHVARLVAGGGAYAAGQALPAHSSGPQFAASALRAASTAAPGAPQAPLTSMAGSPRRPTQPYSSDLDELDVVRPRDVALMRFKRNHDFCEELFSLHAVKDIVPPLTLPLSVTADNFAQRKKDYQHRADRLRDECEALKEAHSRRMQSIHAQRDQVSQRILTPLAQAESAADLGEIHSRVQALLHVRFEPVEPMRAVPVNVDGAYARAAAFEAERASGEVSADVPMVAT